MIAAIITERGVDWTIESDGSVTHNPECNCGECPQSRKAEGFDWAALVRLRKTK